MASAYDDGGQDLRHELVVNTIPGMVLAVLAVVSRFAARRIKGIPLAWHDFYIVLGVVGSLAQSALVLASAKQGIGLHIVFVSAENLRNIFILEYVAKIDYALTFTFVKVSMILLYRSIFPGKFCAIATGVVMSYVVVWGVTVVVVSIFSCTPVNGFWDTDIPSTCISSISFFEWTTLTNVLGDILILVLPVRQVWKLQMNTRRKIAVSLMFLMGGFVIVATVIRLVYMMKMDVNDATWTYVQPAYWFTIELNLAVISACLPCLKPLVIYLWPTALASTISSFVSRQRRNRSSSISKFQGGSSSNKGGEKEWGASLNPQGTITMSVDNASTVPFSDVYSSITNEKSSSTWTSKSTHSPADTCAAASFAHSSDKTSVNVTVTTPSSSSFHFPFGPATTRAPQLLELGCNDTARDPPPPHPNPSKDKLQREAPFFPGPSLAAIPMAPASIPMPPPLPACFAPEDAALQLPLLQGGEERGRRGIRSSIRGWSWPNQYAISESGITDTGGLGVDFTEGFCGSTDGSRAEEGLEVAEDDDDDDHNDDRYT